MDASALQSLWTDSALRTCPLEAFLKPQPARGVGLTEKRASESVFRYSVNRFTRSAMAHSCIPDLGLNPVSPTSRFIRNRSGQNLFTGHITGRRTVSPDSQKRYGPTHANSGWFGSQRISTPRPRMVDSVAAGRPSLRAGLPGDRCADLEPVAWYGGNSGGSTHPVKTKQPNAWGLYDMNGNVAQWCSDWWGNYTADEQDDPMGPSTGTGRIARGGAWDRDAGHCGFVEHRPTPPGCGVPGLGLRFVIPYVP